MTSWHIHIEGQVQGVGFRPFVYREAIAHHLLGWVNNTNDGVHIEFNASRQQAQAFYHAILQNAPKLAYITQHKLEEIAQKFFDKFQIIHSEATGPASLLLTPDVAMCPACRKELFDRDNRRYHYAFITCTDCGVRFSITKQLPYDRPLTSMEPFHMCSSCEEEYEDPLNRRYYSQTNSCLDCRVQLSFLDRNKGLENISTELLIQEVIQAWKDGEIVAIKGIGGYLLCCDAQHPSVVERLRERKNRPSKPFALMMERVEDISQWAEVSPAEMEVLSYPIGAIALLPLKEEAKDKLALNAIAPHLNRVGIMPAYAPLLAILLKAYGQPIIATSGNISNAPIVYQDQVAKQELFEVADAIVLHNREILIPQDDSVIQFSPQYQQRVILRRSRGLAPTFIHPDRIKDQRTILAMGAMLKSTFCLQHSQNLYLSQYLGDLQNFATEEHYKHTIQHFLQLLNTKPKYLLIDDHPNYPSSIHAQELAEQWAIPIKRIQHHEAHFAAVLGENQLLHSNGKTLGVIWDGTGLGSDGQIWGGEFFIYENYALERATHLQYFNSILGDKMAKEPRISALSLAWNIPGAKQHLKKKFSKLEWSIYSKKMQQPKPLLTSSMGRLFDGVASLLGIGDKQTYEGEAAIQLQVLAESLFKQKTYSFSAAYPFYFSPNQGISFDEMLQGIIKDLNNRVDPAIIAAKFHNSLVNGIQSIADHLKLQKIAFSGGVFQNALLVDLIIHRLGQDYQLFWHQQLSPNDENISYGQLIHDKIEQERLKTEKYVFSNSWKN